MMVCYILLKNSKRKTLKIFGTVLHGETHFIDKFHMPDLDIDGKIPYTAEKTNYSFKFTILPFFLQASLSSSVNLHVITHRDCRYTML